MKNIDQNRTLKDLKAFELFFENNYQLASLIAYKYTKDIGIAEDLTQEVFASIWKRRNDINLKSSLRSYLLAAIRKAAIKHSERKKKNAILIEDKSIAEVQQIAEEENYSNEALAVAISNAIEKLPPRRRRVFKLAYYEQLSYKEIANELEVSVNTVKTHIVQSYKSLKVELSERVLNLIYLFRRNKTKKNNQKLTLSDFSGTYLMKWHWKIKIITNGKKRLTSFIEAITLKFQFLKVKNLNSPKNFLIYTKKHLLYPNSPKKKVHGNLF